jgi:murein L,D-transpeptidase YcbB/YkuD
VSDHSRRRSALLIPLLVSAIAVSVPAPASAQNLFETLFGRRKVREFPPPPPPASQYQVPAAKKKTAPKPVAVAKITSPTYSSYRPDALVRVDFAKLLTTGTVTEPLAPEVAQATFAVRAEGLIDVKMMAEKSIAKAIVDWYAANPAPLWLENDRPNAKAKEAMRVLGAAADDGLTPTDYSVTPPSTNGDPAAVETDLLRFETELTARVLRYVQDAHGGRIDANRISGYYDFPARPVDFSATLQSLAASSDVQAMLQAEQPQNREYKLLRQELAVLREQADVAISVDPKLLLKPGESSSELPKLVRLVSRDLDDEIGGEFGETLYNSASSELYSDELVAAFKAIQKKAGLKPDGVIGPRSVQALAGMSKADRMQKVVVAMEQMRWLPRELGDTRVFINQPAFTAAYIDGGEEQLSMRVVIGKTTNQTSFFYDEIEQVDFNPYWGVPQSILVNEMLPRLRRDPGYLDRSGYQVFDAKGKKVSSSAVAWGSYGSKIPYSVRQDPSEANALGELKILFPNKHAIYMHDTPQKAFFQRDQRALSHGCVRLADPRGMAAAVLGKPISYVENKLAQGHSMEKVSRKIPVYVAYFTAWPDKQGAIEYFGDVYGRDAYLLDAIEKTGQVRSPSV